MPYLYISEFANSGADLNERGLSVAQLPPLTVQRIAVGGTSVVSATLGELTTLVRLHTDVACSIDTAVAPVATTLKPRMPADSTEYFGVVRNSGLKIAVIVN